MAARFPLFPLLLCALLGAVHAGAAAQKPAGPPVDYLAPLASLEQEVASLPPQAWRAYGPARTDELTAAVDKVNGQLQMLAVARAFAGDTEGAMSAFDLAFRSAPLDRAALAAPLAQVEQARAEDAIEAIVAQARNRQVVIINEAHHVPLHRAFAMKLAAALRKIGYGYLACETFDGDGDMGARAPGQAIFETGFYTREPVFAGFINAALADGWKPVAYEYQPPPGKNATLPDREQGEARNLVERIFAKDKHAKVLVFVGYDHVFKTRPDEASERTDRMAEYLRRLTGLDPLSVDQVEFTPHPDTRDESVLYAAMLDRFPLREPFVLRSPDGGHPVLPAAKGKRDMRGRIDMQVVFPRYGQRDGRAEWLQTLAGRAPRDIPAGLLPKQGRRVIKAFRSADRPDAVPADVVLVEAGKPAPKLMLPAGESRYAVEE